MTITQINIKADSNLKNQAQAILDGLGLDMTTAFNLFLRQVVYKEPLPFENTEPRQTIKMRTGVYDPQNCTESDRQRMLKNRLSTKGIMKGEIWISDDFNSPVDDMKEYME